MPATATLTRPAFSDVDSLTAARFNDVTILSAIVPDATGAAEGVVRLAGDLTGSASAPQLATANLAPGTYGSATQVARVTVDTKGRVTLAENVAIAFPAVPEASETVSGTIRLAGDLTGDPDAPELAETGVVAGTYGDVGGTTAPLLVVDAKGRITSASSIPIPNPEATDSVTGRVRLTGDFAGTAASPQLATMPGLTAGVYGDHTTRQIPVIVIDAKGRITAAQTSPLADPAGLAAAWVNFDGNSTASFRTGLAYSRNANVVEITAPAHGFRVGDRVSCDFTSGTAVDGLYTIETVPTADTFTFTLAGANTGGNVTLEIYTLRKTRNVHSVVADPRYAASSFWVNFTNALPDAAYLVQLSGEHLVGTGISAQGVNAPGGVAAQDTRGFSLRCSLAARNLHAVVFA